MVEPAQILPDLEATVCVPSFEKFAISGVYFLYRDGNVVYVGRAVDVRRRLADHIAEGLKVFDAVSCLPCPIASLDRTERHYITQLLPEYNQCNHTKALRFAEQKQGADLPAACKPIMNDEEAAEYLGVDVAVLRQWRRDGCGPRLRRIARRRKQVYLFTELRRFAEATAG